MSAEFMESYLKRIRRLRIEVPGVFLHDAEYTFYVTEQARKDGIIRIYQDGEEKIRLHPHGEIEVL